MAATFCELKQKEIFGGDRRDKFENKKLPKQHAEKKNPLVVHLLYRKAPEKTRWQVAQNEKAGYNQFRILKGGQTHVGSWDKSSGI